MGWADAGFVAALVVVIVAVPPLLDRLAGRPDRAARRAEREAIAAGAEYARQMRASRGRIAIVAAVHQLEAEQQQADA